MGRILPIILILLGITELIVVFLNIKMPVIITMALGVLFIASGVKMLLDIAGKKQREIPRYSAGEVFMRIIAVIATLAAAFLGSWAVGMVGAAINWPRAGAVFGVVTMGLYLLYVLRRKDR